MLALCVCCATVKTLQPENDVDDYEVKAAYTMRDGADVRCGWDLFERGHWAQRFATKREAAVAVRRLQDAQAGLAVARSIVRGVLDAIA